jgi:hypothetical protein
MILLVTPSTRAQDCAQAIQAATELPTTTASSSQAASVLLRATEFAAVRLSVQRTLCSELSRTVTAMLLSCEMALSAQGLPRPAADKLRTLHDLACELGARLCMDVSGAS